MVHAAGGGRQVRIYAATTREMVERARQIHQTSPVATAALGRLLTAGAMMGSMMKGEKDILTLKVQCQGPIGGMTVTAKSDGTVKGYVVNPDVILPANDKGKLDVGGALGLGVLSVIKDLGMKEPYIGQTHLVTGEIAEDLTYYYATSEQVNSSVALGVLMEKNNTVKQAGGFILQLMPFAEESVIEQLEKNIASIPSVTTMLEQGMTPKDMVLKVLEGLDVEFYDEIPTGYVCDCSRDRVEKAIISIGQKEIQQMIDDKKPIEVNCDFCGKHYSFNVNELQQMLRRATRK